jgi:hypothetical protein
MTADEWAEQRRRRVRSRNFPAVLIQCIRWQAASSQLSKFRIATDLQHGIQSRRISDDAERVEKARKALVE